MKKQAFVKTVEALLAGVKDNCLSPEDFMYRLNDFYMHEPIPPGKEVTERRLKK